jgi:glucosamine--fructose-6-phosphate aminotransferase (isomerizing)
MKSLMRQEIEEIPAAITRLLGEGEAEFRAAGMALRERDPVAVVTIARGSSDHAAAFLKYAIELTAGVPVASIGPSIASIYGRPIRLARCAAIGVSQSGQSPDIVAMAEAARRGGALTLAITNVAGSPLARAAEFPLDLRAGPERSVAATKSFVASVVAGLVVVAHWTGNAELQTALARLPQGLGAALACDWGPILDVLSPQRSAYVLGRGPALAIANEAALKLKETCGIHAEAYSAAEVVHGPARIVEDGFPVLALAGHDAAEASVAEIADRLAGQGALAFATTSRAAAAEVLPAADTGHPITDALALVVTFYGMVEALSRRLGNDPDHPPHLRKVTETL